ncbi:hypothetical protein DPMN_057759 [Dreissena polymorpha]|uniref:Uncharacterized protein n=1 Tax=Dreissena polymorpha TaxID=45954 RepID=A0A9D4HCJ0_DREPO|nr:hypothetical protein DPMN_057759 [Dreissena polymorpha]
MDTVKSVSWEEPLLGAYRGDNDNAPRVKSVPNRDSSDNSAISAIVSRVYLVEGYV